MKKLQKGLVVGAMAFCVAGVARAEDTNVGATDTMDCQANETREECLERLGQTGVDEGVEQGEDVRTGYEEQTDEAAQGADDMSQGAQEEGEDVRTGMQESADETEQKAEDAQQGIGQKADKAGEEVKEEAQDAKQGVQGVAQDARSEISEVRQEITQGGGGDRGMLRDGAAIENTITTNPLGLFGGEGLNAEFSRPLNPKLSGVAGANYSRTEAAAGGAVTNIGVMAGVDYFLYGQNNEGLRVGPRVSLGGGGEDIGDAAGFAELGLAGELGYNWVAQNGLTAGAAGGLGTELSGTFGAEGDLGAALDPYARLNIGYSW